MFLICEQKICENIAPFKEMDVNHYPLGLTTQYENFASPLQIRSTIKQLGPKIRMISIASKLCKPVFLPVLVYPFLENIFAVF